MTYRCFTRGNGKVSDGFLAKSRCQETSGDSRTFLSPSQEIVWQIKGQIFFYTLLFLGGIEQRKINFSGGRYVTIQQSLGSCLQIFAKLS